MNSNTRTFGALCIALGAALLAAHSADAQDCAPGTDKYLEIPSPRFDPEYVSPDAFNLEVVQRVDRYGRQIVSLENAALALAELSEAAERTGAAVTVSARHYWAEFDKTGRVSEKAEKEYAYWIVEANTQKDFLNAADQAVGSGATEVTRSLGAPRTDPGFYQARELAHNTDERLLYTARAHYLEYSHCRMHPGESPMANVEYTLLRTKPLNRWEYARSEAQNIADMRFSDQELNAIADKILEHSQNPIPGFRIDDKDAILSALARSEIDDQRAKFDAYLNRSDQIIGLGPKDVVWEHTLTFVIDSPRRLAESKLQTNFSQFEPSTHQSREGALMAALGKRGLSKELEPDRFQSRFDRAIGNLGLELDYFDKNTYWSRIRSGTAPNPYRAAMPLRDAVECADRSYREVAWQLFDRYQNLFMAPPPGLGRRWVALSNKEYRVKQDGNISTVAHDAYWLAMLSCGSGVPVSPDDRAMRPTFKKYDVAQSRIDRLAGKEKVEPATVRTDSKIEANIGLNRGRTVIIDARLLIDASGNTRGTPPDYVHVSNLVRRAMSARRSAEINSQFGGRAKVILENSGVLSEKTMQFVANSDPDVIELK